MRELKLVGAMLGIWLAAVLIVMQLSTLIIFPQTNFLGIGYAQAWTWSVWPLANFDGEHYLSIATRGYGQYEYAFFPIYPLILYLGGLIVGDVLLIGLVLGLVLTSGLFYLLVKLARIDYSFPVVVRGLVLMLSFPTAFYLVSIYTEALFLCLVVGAFLAARQQKMWLAGILGLGASMTRLVGVLLWPALVWARRFKGIAWLWLIPVGTVIVLVINYFLSGDPLSFIAVQSKFNATRSVDGVILLPQVGWRYLKILTTTPVNSLAFYIAAQELVITGLIIGLLLVFWRRIRPEYWLFSAGAIIIPTLTGTLSSMPRYALAAWPLFFVTAELVENKYVFALIVGIMIVLQVINLMLFSNGYFVA